MKPDKKKYLTPILAIIFLVVTMIVIPLIVAETSHKHARNVTTVSSVPPMSGGRSLASTGWA